MLIALFIAFAWALAWLLFDSYNTNKGIKAGIAVEGNTMIIFFWGSKPKFWQLWSVDGALRLAIFLAALLVPLSAAPLLGTGALAVWGFKNLQGGRQWQWMFKNPGKRIPEMTTVWGKIMGFWG